MGHPTHLKIKVVGCGGVGLCLLNVLPRYLSYQDQFRQVNIALVDGDEYENGNRPRQAFGRLGNKAEVTAETIGKEFPRLGVSAVTEYLTPDNVWAVIRDGDVVFGCVDNHATRKLLNDQCLTLKNGVLITGGNEYTDGNIQVHVRKDGRNLTLPVANKYHPEVAAPTDKNPGEAVRAAGCDVVVASAPQLLIANNMVAALMLNAFYGWSQGAFEGDKKYDEVYGDVLLNRSAPRSRK